MSSTGEPLTRDQKAENLVLNYSMIMMGVFEGVFAALASKMSEAMVAGAEAMSEAMKAGTTVTSAPKAQKGASQERRNTTGFQVSEEVKKMFSDMRRDLAAKMSTGDDSLKRYLKDPRFDEGIKIVDGYEFGLPKLTEPMGDEDIAAYLTLVAKEDAELGKMLRELSVWQEKMPKLRKVEQ